MSHKINCHKLTSLNSLFCLTTSPKPKGVWSTTILNREKQQNQKMFGIFAGKITWKINWLTKVASANIINNQISLSPPSTEGSDAGDTERLEELPLCSCRMEAPRVDSTSHRVSRPCMATESINGEVCLCLGFFCVCVDSAGWWCLSVCSLCRFGQWDIVSAGLW